MTRQEEIDERLSALNAELTRLYANESFHTEAYIDEEAARIRRAIQGVRSQ